MELNIWKGDWGLASVDFDCLRVLTYIKFIGVPVKVIESNSPFFTPNGRLPVFKDNGQMVTNFDDVVENLRSLSYSTDVNLDSRQVAEVSAFTQYLQEKLYPALQFAFWVDEKNFNDLTRPWYGKALSLPFNFYYPSKYQTEAKNFVDALYGEHCDLEVVEHDIYKEAEKCLQALSDRLGEHNYFFGNKPSSFDATVFAYIAPILKAPFPSASIQAVLKKFPNLVRFIGRICQKNFKKVTDEYDAQLKTKISASATSKDLIPHQTRNKLLAAIFAFIAMSGYAYSNGLFERISRWNWKSILIISKIRLLKKRIDKVKKLKDDLAQQQNENQI